MYDETVSDFFLQNEFFSAGNNFLFEIKLFDIENRIQEGKF